MDASPKRIGDRPVAAWAAPAAVGLATLAAFVPVLSNAFIDWDDGANFLNNPSYRGLGWSHLAWMATTFHRGVYQPLAWLLAAIEFQIGGLAPWVYHAGSWLLHALAAVLVYALGRRLFARLAPDHGPAASFAAASAALLWSVHPLRVEPVAWASAQGYPLAAGFALGSILAWLKARDAERPWGRWYAASVSLALCAYLAKPVAITLPAVLVILDWYLSRDPARWLTPRAWLPLLPFLAPAALVAVAAPLARARLGASASAQFPLIDRLAQACYGAAYYAIKSAVPSGLTVFTPLPRPFDPFEPRFAAAAFGLIAAAAAIAWAGRRAPGLIACALAYLVLLAPVLGVIRQGDQLVADRYAYLAGVPVALALGGGLLRGLTRRTVKTAAALAVMASGVILGLGVISWNLTLAWRDAGTLWARAVAVDPNSYQAHTNLGIYELAHRRYDAAIREFDASIALNPRSSNARFDRGLALAKQGRTADAIASYQAGLALDPDDPTAHAHLGDLFASTTRWEDAEREYRAALRRVPHPDLFNSLGVALAQQGRLADAAVAFREALAIDPGHADARANLEMAIGSDSTR